MLLPLAGLIIGVLLALALSVRVDTEMARYTGVVILVGLASILGAIRAELESEYDNRVFVGGFVVNTAAAVPMAQLDRDTDQGR